MYLETSNLIASSREVIKAHQAPSGAYYADPTYPNYRFAWLRDVAMIADAASRMGMTRSAENSFNFLSRIIVAREGRIMREEKLDTRYTVEGMEDKGPWPSNFQLDGYGYFLHVLNGHMLRWNRPMTSLWRQAIRLCAIYLLKHKDVPCFDLWEDKPGFHPFTRACTARGLMVAGEVTEAEKIYKTVELENPELDASLLYLPSLGATSMTSRQFTRIFEEIEAKLVSPSGGVWRYLGDEYYGGGEWILLTALLGSCESALGMRKEALGRMEWITAHANADGSLPEQAQDNLQCPEKYDEWVEKAGPPAQHLTWSSAQTINFALDLKAAAA